MDADTIKDICIKSCRAYYNYVKRNNKGRDEIKATYRLPKDGCISLKLYSKLWNLDGLILNIDGRDYKEPDVNIRSYNEITKQLVVIPSQKVMSILSDTNKHDVRVVTDLSWLILSTKKFYEEHGHLIRYPDYQPLFHKVDCVFSDNYSLLPNQENALRIALNNRLSYIWGAPGTGKTQCVLTTCAMSYAAKGKRVAIIAPTNNALDHVLKSVIKEIENNYSSLNIDLNKDIVRLGTATAEFFNEYPSVCTSSTISKHLSFKKQTLRDLYNTRNKITAESLKPAFIALSEIIRAYDDSSDLKKMILRRNILESFNQIKKDVISIGDYGYLFEDADEFNVCNRINQLIQLLYGQTSYGVQGEFDPYSNKTLSAWIKEYESKIIEMESSGGNTNIDNAKIIAMTPQTMMLLFDPNNLKVDHIFLDEANYSSVINTLPLFVFGVPITMCGDHMQLPPVCVINKDEIKTAIEEKTDDKYCMLWSMNALYSEGFLFKPLGKIVQDYIDGEPFDFEYTKQANLTTSYRFGNNLAQVLDRFVYRNNITGVASAPIKIVSVNAVNPSNGNNENSAEADAIYKLLLKKQLKKKEYVILTPYKNQVRLLKNHPQKKKLDHSPNIMTIHASEGKEWDTVIISIVDDRPGKILTSTSNKDGPGLNTINTAISRAKKRIVIVCNMEYWSQRNDELVSALINLDR